MAEAKLNREYAIRLCGVGAIMLALTGWSLYDGFIGWPSINRQYEKVRPELIGISESGLPPEVWFQTVIVAEKQGTNVVTKVNPDSPYLLKAVFDKHGVEVPKHLVQQLQTMKAPEGNDPDSVKKRAEAAVEIFKKDIYSEAKIHGQYVQAGITLTLSLLAFNAVWSKRKKQYIVDENGLSGSGFNDRHYTWDQVKSVDWTKWRAKGIITVVITNGPRFKLDGWHFAGMRPVADIIRERFPEPAE